jgi:hypothetical protein
MSNNIIVATWGTGPTYRNRIKHNIQKAIDTGYDNVMDYIIMTDYPEDFYEFRDKTKKIIDIINIHEVRPRYSDWTLDYEFIPKALDEENYAKEWRHNREHYNWFTYALNRFSLPRISELGYSKFIMCDCDVDIRYDRIVNKECTEEQFWEQYNTPINSMKGCDYEIHDIKNININNIDTFNDHNLYSRLVLGSILRYELGKKFPDKYINEKSNLFATKVIQTEGPFRYYNLANSNMVKEYFDVWDEAVKINIKDEYLKRLQVGSTYMIIDNIPVAITNEFMNIQVLNFDKYWHTVHLYYQDRHFFPRGTVGTDGLSLQPALTMDEFYKINEQHINYLKAVGGPAGWVE